jgi:uncharacterized protein (DUF427 family)
MSLTMGAGPLTAREAHPSNYEIQGPRHRLVWGEFPRRVRGELEGVTVFDTRAGRLLHESEMLPVLYVPEADLELGLLEPTETQTTCPFKGEASYWSVRVGERLSIDAAWSYPEPLADAEWLSGHYAFYWDRLDAFYDEEERVEGHLRDPFHRVDIRLSSRPVTVRVGGELVAETSRPWVLSETGLPNRLYIPLEDVRIETLKRSQRRTHCPYKGDAGYWSHAASGSDDIAWSYAEPFDGAARIADAISFHGDEVEIES